ncbi:MULTISPECIES: hypothetical protein [Flavobacteriaceae]|uniref:EF-hand domain-containing protein n=2 Tax=Flavobacteriaceae TaxID=49546 RepID=A0A4Y8AUV2_9FLAO|nr:MULTISPECIES: hypothetical protein [Flavobacteriaceae]TEW75253.1 hypothetical protein E2488_06975 [Gramella jeungdoensis]GGK43641.1 hypothetical protein GCM10007963_09790 [Lutibacter litoralis]
MKKLSILIFFVFTTIGYSQKKVTEPDQNKMSLVEVMVAAGISSATSTFSDNSYAADGSFFEVSSTYYFSKIGLGISLGSFSNPTEGNLLKFANEASYPIELNSEKWKTSYYGIGPSYRTNFGDIEATIFGRAGIMSVKPILLEGNFNVENADAATTIPVYNFSTNETSNVGFYNAGIRLGYKLNPNFGLYITANYMSAFSDAIIAQDGRKEFIDLNQDGEITADEIQKLGGEVQFQYTEKNIQPQVFNYGFGLSYSFGKKTTTSIEPPSRGHTNPYFVSNELEGEMVELKNSGSVVFTNASQKDKKRQQKIIGVLPKNNSIFKNADEIKNFNWQVIGAKIANPQFIIEVTKIGSNQQPQRTFIEKTTSTSLGATRIFKESNLSDGQYRWKVTETTIGNSSDIMFFTFSNCEIDFAISNEEIECLGYEGENRKFKICFDSTYSSTSGDLTFANPGSGLSVFNQTYAALTYTMVSPNPTLLTQIGASISTVSYCFEVTVPASVTSIGFGLQGDDLDPSPVLCQPGVSANFDELPDCICDDCEEMELSFDNFNISLNGASGNQFNFDGDINVNVPIYGIEFQIQSFSYTANPSACTEGVSNVEESGMFLMPGTTINGSSSFQLVNETASGSPSSNDNATKNIKYTSNSALTGAIPVNLTIGLPGPISGLDPSCCEIEYTVCIKVKVFYEESNCKSCDFTHCFNFNNQ